VISTHTTEIYTALASPELKEKLLTVGVQPLGTSPGQFGSFIRSEAVRFAKVVKDAGIKPE
jgi:tripartite-type tricarboxylate transporter receptor subunit TctC